MKLFICSLQKLRLQLKSPRLFHLPAKSKIKIYILHLQYKTTNNYSSINTYIKLSIIIFPTFINNNNNVGTIKIPTSVI